MPERPALDLRALEVFVTVVEAGGMTAAAQRLGTTQSAVSQTITGLETTLAVQLVDRSVRPVALTVAGSILHQRAREMLDRARETMQAVRSAARVALPHLRIGLVDAFAATAGPPLIAELADTAVNWSVWSGLHPELRAAFVRRELDLIVSTDELRDMPGLVRHRLLSEPYFLALPGDYHGPTDSLPAIARHLDLIRYTSRSLIGVDTEAYLRHAGIRAPRRLEFDTADVVLAMVAGGIGWALTTPLCALHGAVHLSRLRLVPLPGGGFRRTLWMVAREQELLDLPARVAASATAVLRRDCLPRLRARVGWVIPQVEIGDEHDGKSPREGSNSPTAS